jgi:hypothetical protein
MKANNEMDLDPKTNDEIMYATLRHSVTIACIYI